MAKPRSQHDLDREVSALILFGGQSALRPGQQLTAGAEKPPRPPLRLAGVLGTRLLE